MDILKFITAGSVDDGKSTLIGRLLYDSKNILIDQLEQLEKLKKNHINGDIDLALLTDGLRAEREQGITIDVAYRYFNTAKRKFIIADAPGHIQYTRNMITGASNADLIIILIDAEKGVVEQTKRHSIIASLLRIPYVLVAINKMDLVNYSKEVFDSIANDYKSLSASLGLRNVHFLPVSALRGDNIVDASENISWYKAKTLLEILETVEIKRDERFQRGRFPVQYVIRPQTTELRDYRGYAGKITSGSFKKGEKVMVLPSGLITTIEAIEVDQKEKEEVFAPQSIVMRLQHDIDISRGDVVVKPGDWPRLENEFDVLLCWMDSKPLIKGRTYWLQQHSNRVKAFVKEIGYRLNVNTLEKEFGVEEAYLNEVVRVTVKTSVPVAIDAYDELKANGAAILIDETSNATAGACLIQ